LELFSLERKAVQLPDGLLRLFMSLRSRLLERFSQANLSQAAWRSGLGAQVGLALRLFAGMSLRSKPREGFPSAKKQLGACCTRLDTRVGLGGNVACVKISLRSTPPEKFLTHKPRSAGAAGAARKSASS